MVSRLCCLCTLFLTPARNNTCTTQPVQSQGELCGSTRQAMKSRESPEIYIGVGRQPITGGASYAGSVDAARSMTRVGADNLRGATDSIPPLHPAGFAVVGIPWGGSDWEAAVGGGFSQRRIGFPTGLVGLDLDGQMGVIEQVGWADCGWIAE